jgi:hypothetical protein
VVAFHGVGGAELAPQVIAGQGVAGERLGHGVGEPVGEPGGVGAELPEELGQPALGFDPGRGAPGIAQDTLLRALR